MKAEACAYVNGRVYTMEREGDRCSAFVVRDGKFLYCGTDEQAKKMADQIVDLNGAVVLPGMIDTHQHVFAYARNLMKLDLSAARSHQELKNMLREYAKDIPEGQWILGAGFDNEKFDDPRMPTRWDLDEVCPDRPVILTRYCLHINVANSKALELGGVGKGFRPAVEGTVVFDADGEPTGVLSDSAAADIIAMVPDSLSTLEAKAAAVEKACHELNKHGLTGVHPIQAKHCDLPEYLDVYQTLAAQNRLTVRIYFGYDEMPNCSIRSGLGDDMVKYGFFKLYGDGNMGGRTAYLKEPYWDDPTQRGVPNYTQEELTARIREAYQRNLQIGVHVIGDQAAEMLTTAIETVYGEDPKPNIRFRMIHMSLLNEDIIRRIQKLPVVVDMQPMFISTNVKWADNRVGPERSKYLFCWKKLLDAGIMLTAGSDAPCESYDPMESVYAVVNRKNLEGYPPEGWHPEERIGVYDALAMYTKNAAYVSYEEDVKGTIREGKLADFVVLDEDPFTVDPMRLKDIKVEKTYLGGSEVYSRQQR